MNTSKKNSYLKGVIFCLLATISWGTMFPIMTHALRIIDPFTFTACRYSIAGIIFLIFLYFKEGTISFKLDNSILLLWIFGSAGFAGFGFFVFLGQKLAGPEGALSASMMMATMPLLGLLLTWLLKGLRPSAFTFACVALSLFGVILVITKGSPLLVLTSPENYRANLLMLFGAVCWVLYTMGATYFPNWSPIKYTAVTTLFGLPTIYVVTIFLLVKGTIEFPSIASMINIFPDLIYMSLVAGFMGVLCWNSGNKIITPINGVLFMDVVPITAFLISMMNGILPVTAQLVGVLFTVMALILNNLFQRRRMIKIQIAKNVVSQ